MTDLPPRHRAERLRQAPRPQLGLVEHEIRIARTQTDDGPAEVVATIECERKSCRMRVEVCAECERFGRIEVHEAGYTMLCRSQEPSEPPAAVDDDDDDEV